MLEIVSFSCPLILAATGALFSEYAGILALFLEGLISLSGFFVFLFTDLTGSIISGTILCVLTCTILSFLFSFIVEKSKANPFISALAINIFLSSVISLLSYLIYHARGVLTSPKFVFPVSSVQIYSVIITILLTTAAFLFLSLTKPGISFRITGSNPQVLAVRGLSPSFYRIAAWTITGFYGAFAGSLLAMRISSYVPNLASSKGWIALAIVFLGRKKMWKIALCGIIFCAADYFTASVQNYFSGIPSSVLLAFPYLIALLLIAFDKNEN